MRLDVKGKKIKQEQLASMYPSGDDRPLESVIMSDQFLQCIQSVDDPTKQQPCQTLPYYGLYMKSCLFYLHSQVAMD